MSRLPRMGVTRSHARNALRLAREAEENARGTIAKLADQSGR